jgi:hypothetical protein
LQQAKAASTTQQRAATAVVVRARDPTQIPTHRITHPHPTPIGNEPIAHLHSRAVLIAGRPEGVGLLLEPRELVIERHHTRRIGAGVAVFAILDH